MKGPTKRARVAAARNVRTLLGQYIHLQDKDLQEAAYESEALAMDAAWEHLLNALDVLDALIELDRHHRRAARSKAADVAAAAAKLNGDTDGPA